MADAARARAEDDREVRAALAATGAARPLAAGILTRIEGGLSNRAWRVDAEGRSWFVRLGHPAAERLGVDRASECAILRAVSAAGLAPAVRACEPSTGLLVTDFVAGRTWSAADATTTGNLRRIAQRLRQLHRLPVPEGVHEVDYPKQAQRLAAGLGAPDRTAIALAGRADVAIRRLGDARLPSALCHNDLHHLNVIDDEACLWLVDWEYGGRGNPLLDLAGFLALHDLGPEPTAVFLAAYGDLPSGDLRRLDEARWLFDYVQWLWYRSRFPDPAGEEAWYAERLAQRLLRCNN